MPDKAVHPCVSAEEAVQLALTASFGSAAIAIRRDGEMADIIFGTMTPFGPVVRAWERVPLAFAEGVLADTLRAADGTVFVYEAPDGREFDGKAFAVFVGRRPEAPVHRNADGIVVARSWTMAPDLEFVIGDELVLTADADERGTTLRYRSRDGRDGGVHVVLDRGISADEADIVSHAKATVTGFAFGADRGPRGEPLPHQVLMLDIPPELARAFPDGRLPLGRKETLDG